MTLLRQITTYATIVGMLAAFAPLSGPASAAEPEHQHKNHKAQQGKAPPAPAPQQRAYTPPPQPRPTSAPVHAQRQPSRDPVASYRPAPTPQPRYEARGRHHDGDRGRRGGGYNAGVAAGVAAIIIGSTLGYRYYRGPSRDSVYDRCDRNFPDFEYDTGTFVNDDGDRELCPYLRAYVD
jgi:hypothetical protein